MTEQFRLPPEPEKLAAALQEALNVLQSDGKGTKALAEETKKRIESAFEAHEELNAQVTEKFVAAEKAKDELKDKLVEAEKQIITLKANEDVYAETKKRIESLELLIAKGGANAADDAKAARERPEYKDFWTMMTTRDDRHQVKHSGMPWVAFRPDVDVKTLRTDSDVQGGYLVPLVTDNEIRKNITEMSPVRSFARVRVASSKTIEIPRRLSIPTASYEGEGEDSDTDQSTYGSEQVTLFRQTVTIPATLDMMISSAFNLEQEIAMDVGEAFGKNEGTQFVNGVGVKGPQGIVKDSRIESVDTVTTGQLDWSDMIEIASKLKRGQAPWYYMNRRTLGYLQRVKSSIGVPIWAPVAGDKPATIWGFPYNSDMIDLADAQSGSGSVCVIFGDLRRGYEIYDLMGISVVRDDLTRKKAAITEWTFRRYNTGRVVIPEAIKLLKVK